MKSAEEILRQDKYNGLTNLSVIYFAMEEYAEQWKYDYSKECKCESRIGETWCCNQCGLPIKNLESENKILKEQVKDMLFIVQSLAKDDDYQVYDAVDADFKNLRDIAKLTFKGIEKTTSI